MKHGGQIRHSWTRLMFRESENVADDDEQSIWTS